MEVTALATDEDVDRFVEQVLCYLRADDFDVKAAIEAVQTDETLHPRFFPFTVESMDAIRAKLTSLTPRAITMQLTRALGRSHRKNLPAITAECVT